MHRLLGRGPGTAIAEISPATLQARLERGERPVVVDVRRPDEWAAGHIGCARHIPLSELAGRLGELDRADEIVLVCRSGRRSAMAALFLMQNGFQRVFNLRGGMLAWKGPVS